MKQHAKQCGFTEQDILEILTEEFCGYTLVKEDEKTLLLQAGHPVMKLRPGFKDRYEGGEWKSIYEARFRWNERKIEESGQKDLKSWFYLIAQGTIPYVGEKSQREVISSVFPVLPDIYDLMMFFQIYGNKGYRVVSYEPSRQVLERYAQLRPGELAASMAKWKNKQAGRGAVYADTVEDQGHTLLAMRLYLYEEETKAYHLYFFLFGEGILYMKGKGLPEHVTEFVLGLPALEDGIKDETVKRFEAACPSFGFDAYRKGGGENPLLPFLLGGNFHKGMELLIRGGLSWYAEHYFTLHKPLRASLFRKEPRAWTYRNIPELLGMPLFLLKTVSPSLLRDEDTRKRLGYCYKAKRSLLEGIVLNRNVIRFVEENDVTKDHSVYRSRIAGLNRLPDSEIRKILHYLSAHDDMEYEYYRDYLQMMQMTGITTFGLCPRNIIEAHDDLMRSMQTAEERSQNEQFKTAVEKYQYLKTERTPEETEDQQGDPELSAKETKDQQGDPELSSKETEDHQTDIELLAKKPENPKAALEAFVQESPYFITCPKDVSDLNREGRSQHNCVASYRNAVIQSRSQILFMRRKETPEESLVTIEVQKMRLIQAKAAYNQTASIECQTFICRWCELEGISYENCRDITLKKTG